MAEYDRVQPTRAPLTFAQVEDIWEDEVRPELKNFSSMQQAPEPPPEDSSVVRQLPHPRPELGQT